MRVVHHCGPWLALALLAFPAAAQDADDVARQRWANCAFGSFKAQSQANPDKYSAAEAALYSCKTEKSNFIRVLSGLVSPEHHANVREAANSLEADWKAVMTSAAVPGRR
jgi:hypothetical protein